MRGRVPGSRTGFAVCYLSGVVAGVSQAQLANESLLFLFCSTAMFVGIRFSKWHVFGLVLGYCLCSLHGHQYMKNRIDAEVVVNLQGIIESVPLVVQHGWRFDVRVTSSDPVMAVTRVRLFMEAGQQTPQAGEQWRFTAKLKPPSGSVNPPLFDYAAWQMARGYHAVGSASHAVRVGQARNVVGVRQHIANKVHGVLGADQGGKLLALMIGESSGLSRHEWDILSRTGTNHLFIVSGLHIGLVAGATLLCFRLIPGVRASGLIGSAVIMSMVVGYGMMAGMGLPVQRAIVMTLIGVMVAALSREFEIWDGFAIALVLVLTINPFQVLTAGFWLSFGAVALLIFTMRDAAHQPLWLSYLKTQLVMFVGLAPLLVIWVYQVSVVAPVANLVVI